MKSTNSKDVKEPKSKADFISFCHDWIKRIDDEWSVINTDNQEALRFYRSDPSILPLVEGRSQVTTTDMMDAIENAKPMMMEIFCGGDEIISLEPRSAEDVEPVKRLQILSNDQVKKKNNWFVVFHDWLDEAFKLKIGAIKYKWHKDVNTVEKRYEGINQFDLQAIVDKGYEIVNLEKIQETVVVEDAAAIQVEPTFNVDVVKRVEDEYVKFTPCPSEEIGFPIKTRDIDADTPFFYHRIKMPKWKFIQTYGQAKFNQVEGQKDDEIKGSKQGIENERFADLGGFKSVYDSEKDEYCVYECYFPNPKDGTAWIFAFNGDIELQNEKNTYKKPPFRTLTPFKMAHRVIGFSFFDLIKEIQKMRTAMLRQIFDNTYQANHRRYFIDQDRVNMDDFLNNSTMNAMIRTDGDPRNVAMPEVKAPLPPEVFTFWEMLNVEKDYHSGVPRSFQGVNPAVMNDTFRGQNQQIGQAAQRLKMMARLIAEMAVAPLFNDVIDCNLWFMQKKTQVRYLNNWIEIDPDNIFGRFDLTVNVGIGTNDKLNTVAEMQQLLGLYAQIYKSGIPVISAQNAYSALKELVKAMGYKNTADFVTDPALYQSVVQLVQTTIGHLQQMPPSPEVQQMAMLVQQVIGAMGINPQNVSSASFPGQNTPQNPNVPAQAMNPRTTPGGGDFFA